MTMSMVSLAVIGSGRPLRLPTRAFVGGERHLLIVAARSAGAEACRYVAASLIGR
jgi:hypothetical protein